MGIAELQNDFKQVQDRIHSLKEQLSEQTSDQMERGMSFMQAKNHLMVQYAANYLFYSLLKMESPEDIKGHPVFTDLVKTRLIIERTRPLDRKLKYQIDKLLQLAASNGERTDENLDFAPNPDELVSKLDNEDDDENENGDADQNDGIYRAPRMASVPYEEESVAKKREKQEERNQKRMKKSAILNELRAEFSERPEEIQVSGAAALDKELHKERKEKEEYEEARFVRLVTSRKDKVRQRQRERDAMRIDSVAEIDNFAGIQDAMGVERPTRKFTPTKSKLGGKTGGIFAHVRSEEVHSDRKRSRSSKSSESASKRTKSHAPTPSKASSSGPKQKKKVQFRGFF